MSEMTFALDGLPIPLVAAGTPDVSKLLPLAVVDAVDTAAVTALLAVIPKADGSGLRAFERRDGGWIEKPKYVADLAGVSPPPVVELDRDTFLTVVKQIDEYDRAKAEKKK